MRPSARHTAGLPWCADELFAFSLREMLKTSSCSPGAGSGPWVEPAPQQHIVNHPPLEEPCPGSGPHIRRAGPECSRTAVAPEGACGPPRKQHINPPAPLTCFPGDSGPLAQPSSSRRPPQTPQTGRCLKVLAEGRSPFSVALAPVQSPHRRCRPVHTPAFQMLSRDGVLWGVGGRPGAEGAAEGPTGKAGCAQATALRGPHEALPAPCAAGQGAPQPSFLGSEAGYRLS